MSADAEFKSFIDRILKLKEEQDAIGDDVKNIYADMKALGYDKTAAGALVAELRKKAKNGEKFEEKSAILDSYREAYERASASHTHARARERATPAPRRPAVAGGQPSDAVRVIVQAGISYEVLIDAADAYHLEGGNWEVEKNRNTFYLRGTAANPAGRRYLHRIIVDAPEGAQVDHKDGNGLNLCRRNLRLATRQQNAANRTKGSFENATSQFKGVYEPRPGRYVAQITVNNERKHLGTFDTEEEAARCYDRAAVEAFGDFAKVNFPEQAANEFAPASLRRNAFVLRPHCQNPSDCGGYGTNHCHTCLKASGVSRSPMEAA